MDFEAGKPQPCEHGPQVLLMLPHVAALDDDIIYVTPRKRQPRQHLVHLALEICGGIFQPEGHHTPLPQYALSALKGRLGTIRRSECHLVVARPRVQFGEDLSSPHVVEDGFDQRQLVPVQIGL